MDSGVLDILQTQIIGKSIALRTLLSSILVNELCALRKRGLYCLQNCAGSGFGLA